MPVVKPFLLILLVLATPIAMQCHAHGDHEHHLEQGLTKDNGRVFVVRIIHKMTLRDFKLGAGILDESWRKTRMKQVIFDAKIGNNYRYKAANTTTQESLTVIINAIGKPVSASLQATNHAQ